MSLYNALHGVNPLAGMLLAALGTDPSKIPRFRDAYVSEGHIIIHTRTGGGNRDYYESEESCLKNYPEYFTGESPDEPNGPWNSDLRSLPGYVKDTDDDFDSTYANFYYQPPEELAAMIALIDGIEPPPAEKWKKLFAELESGEQTPAVKHALEVGKPIIDAITKLVNERE